MLHPRQEQSIRAAQARLNIWEGSVRSGKTIGSIIRWARFCAVDAPPGRLLMIGKTERTLIRNVLDPTIDLLGAANVQVNRGEGTATIFDRRCFLAGANDASSEGKIRGLTLAGAYGDELTLWPEAFWTMLLSRLSVPGAKLFGTTNPDGPSHWLKRQYLDRAEQLSLARFSFRLADNPALDPAYVDALHAEYVGLWRKRFIDGLWVQAEGAIYDMFDPDGRHVATPPDTTSWARFWVGVDYGTTNPFHAVLLAEAVDGTTWVLDEWRHDSRQALRQLTDATYADELCGWLARHAEQHDRRPFLDAIYVDPSAASFIVELQERGQPVQPAENPVGDGIRTVAKAFAADRLRIHPGCTHLIREIEGYVWDPKAQTRGDDKPLKVDDHGPDALRYAVFSHRHGAPAMAGQAW